MKFEDVIGQEALKSHMQSAIRFGKVSHAYIINGEAGYGKLKLAEAFAKTLLCSRMNPDYDEDQIAFPGLELEAKPTMPDVIKPCEECISCTKADHHNHPDIIYISHEKPKLISVKEIREQIVDTVDILPYESKRKIYIIDHGEFMNEMGQNILLKTIEEPPEYITIIILTNNKDTMLPTILSRCVILNVMPVEDSVIKSYLMREGIVDYQADMAINFAGGNPGKALLIASDPEFQMRRKEVVDVMRDFGIFNSKQISDVASRWESDKENKENYLDLMIAFLRDVLIYKNVEDETRLHFRREISVIRELSEIPSSTISKMIDIVEEALRKLRVGVTPSLTIEMMLYKIKESI
ncbi:MAG: DNA polymerase III subunit [Lachnospiraceae bacterium]|nr:DNA polymerase III subunit [Lachnospiraceae bacterium]